MSLLKAKIGARLIAGFSAVLLLLVLLAAVGLTSLVKVKSNLDLLATQDLVKATEAARMRNDLSQIGTAVRDIGLLKNVVQMQKRAADIKRYQQDYDEAGAAFEKMANPQEKALLESASEMRAATAKPLMYAQELALSFYGDRIAPVLTEQVAPMQQKWFDVLNKLVDNQQRAAAKRVKEAADAYH